MAAEHIVTADYVSGELSAEERRRAEAHLARCARCQAAVDAARNDSDSQTAATLAQFAVHLLQGGLVMIAPPLRQLSLEKAEEGPPAEEEPPSFKPLRILQPRVARGTRGLLRFVGRFGAVLLLTVAVLLLPAPAGLSEEAHRALALFVFTGSILALEPVSLPIAALMVPVAQVALGIATAPVAFETFSRPVVFLILASLFLAEALRKHGLTRRLALRTLVASGGGVSLLLLGLMAVTAAISMWVENTATAAVLIPVAMTIARQVPDPEKARGLLVLLVLGIAYSTSLGGMITIIGSSSNAVTSGFLVQVRDWTFVDWMVYGLPSFLLVFPVTWWLALRMVPVAVDRLDLEAVRQQVERLGLMSSEERTLLGTLGGAAVFWVGGSFLESALNLPPTLLSSAMVAVIAVGFLSVRGIISWEDVKGVSWGIFLIIGAGLSLGEALSRTGATAWFAGLIQPLVTGPPFFVSVLLLVFLSALLTNVMNNTTIAAVFVPILISLAGTNPDFELLQLVMPVALATTFGFSLPSASGSMALVAATGIVDRGEMMRYGLVITLVNSFILGCFFYLLTLLGWT